MKDFMMGVGEILLSDLTNNLILEIQKTGFINIYLLLLIFKLLIIG